MLSWLFRRDARLKYYDYGASIFLHLEVLIYSDDDHHKISCGYIITDHNSALPKSSKERKTERDEAHRDKQR
ncbi:CLUMA_CG007719, isoform A [Clunio marinus]|uniref:CLUMA_CG007719, isoform A n=1 Tax=Clunio marinus TaxID=568069 RepID=A0A1J1I1W5_9DIPT|nr:CLUMA_CG007719, isoform A [Clunio marinus]